MNRDLLRSFLAIISGRFGVLFIGLLITPFLVRLLGSDGYGDYAFIMAALTVLTTFTGRGGVTSGVRKFIVEDRDIDHWSSRVLSFYFQLTIIATGSAALLLVMYAASGSVELHFQETYTIYTYYLGVLIVFYQIFELLRATLMGSGREHISEPLTIIKELVFGVTGLTLIYMGWGVSGALIGQIVSALLGSIICVVVLSEFIELHQLVKLRPKEFPHRELLSFNMTSLILLFLLTSLYNVDLLMLQPLAGSNQTGYYKAALVVAEFLWFVPHAAQMALLHSMSELWSANHIEEISSTASEVTRYTLLFTTLLVIGLATLAEPFMTLYYGEDFAPAVVPLLLLLPGTLGFAVARPILSTGHASGHLRPLIISTSIAAMINLVLNIILIPKYGMYGAAVATSIGYGSMMFLHIWSAKKIGFEPLDDIRVLRIFGAGVAAAAVIFPLARMLPSAEASLILVPPVGFVIFLLTAVGTGAISKTEIAKVKFTVLEKL